MLRFRQFVEDLQEGIPNPAMKSNPAVKQYKKNALNNPNATQFDRSAEITKAYNNILPQLQSAKTSFEKLMRKNIKGKQGNVRIKSRIKPIKSVKDKVFGRGKKFSEMNDLVAGAVMFDTKEEADKFVKDFRRKNGDKVKGYEEKKQANAGEFGYYGAHHLDVEIDGFIFEIQVMTKQLWGRKSVAHDIYTATRSTGGGTKQDKEISRRYFKRGNQQRREHIEFEGLSYTIEELNELGTDWVDLILD